MNKEIITYCDQDFLLSEEFVKITLGLDEYYKKQQVSTNNKFLKAEGLVPVNLTTVTPLTIQGYEEAIDYYKNLYRQLNSIKNELRREYLAKQISGMISYIHYLKGEEMSYRQTVRELLFVDANPVPHLKIERIHKKLDNQLATAGFKGSLAEKYDAYFFARRVEKEDVQSVLVQLAAKAKEDVGQLMFSDIGELEVTPKLVYDAPFSGYADYESREMLLNGDYHYTYESLKHLVAHEVFPGHFTHLFKREQRLNAGLIPLDAGLVITNSASSPIFEGIADCGLTFLRWEQTIFDEIAKTVQLLKMCTTLNAGYLLNELKLSKTDVASYLRNQAFGEEKWIGSRLSFLEDFLRGPFIYAYHRGFESLLPIVLSVPESERQSFYETLYGNMITADELKIY